MTTTTVRPNPRPLLFQNPLCPMCKDEVSHDGDGWVCGDCAAYWANDEGETGEWNDPDQPQCRSQVDASKVRGGTYRCVKSADHVESGSAEGRQHHGPDGAAWPNSWLPEIEPAEVTS